MKSVKFWLGVLFVASPIFIFSNFRPAPTGKLHVNVLGESALSRVRVEVDKPRQRPVVVRVLDQGNWLLHEQKLEGDGQKAQLSLNTCGLPNGNYRLEVTDGQKLHTHAFSLSAPDKSMTVRKIDVYPVD